jgi:hypothetical protein
MYPSMHARRIFDDAWLQICQNDLSTAVGVAAPPVMTLENQHIESLARRVGEPLQSMAGKPRTALDFCSSRPARRPSGEPECGERWTPESKVGRTVGPGFPRIWRRSSC